MLARNQLWTMAILNVVAQVVLGLGAVVLGYRAVTLLAS